MRLALPRGADGTIVCEVEQGPQRRVADARSEWEIVRMRLSACLLSLVGSLLCACTARTGTSRSAASAGTCSPSSLLSGASYDITKSRFAFGSMPSAQDAAKLLRWVGSDGVVAIFSDGSELGSMNANAPESNLPDWSADSAKLSAHASDYWVSMGVASCQITDTGINGSGGGGGSIEGGVTFTAGPSTVTLARGIDGIPVVDSLAAARFDVNDQTTFEAFYWPEIPANVMSAAVAFKNQLADPNALAAYKTMLQADAQGQGRVVIHHTHAGSLSSFQTAATYDVIQTAPLNDGADLNFDQNGNPVTTVW
jgi:hypothetical protein